MSHNQAHMANSLEECLSTLGQFEMNLELFCNATWDGILCWPPTLPGMSIRQHCPTLPGSNTSAFAYKTCRSDGLWESRDDHSTEGGFTNYKNCYSQETKSTNEKFYSTSTKETEQIPEMEHIPNFVNILEIVLNSLSVLSLLVATGLFACCIRKRTQRFKVLIPLFLTTIFKYLLQLTHITLPFVIKDGNRLPPFFAGLAFCKANAFILRFSELSTYSWLVLLGIYYLHVILGDVIRTKRLLIFFLVGLGVPTIFCVAWFVTVYFLLTTASSCQIYNFHNSHWITNAPKLSCMLIAFCLFIVCVYAACRSPMHVVTPELKFAPQGSLKTLLFLILSSAVDLYRLVSLYRGFTNVPDIEMEPLLYTDTVARSAMGFVMAILLCFIDGEVLFCRRDRRKKIFIPLVEKEQNGESRSGQ